MALDKAVLVSAFVFSLPFPLATDQVLLKVRFIGIVVLYLPSVEVLDLEVWKAHCEDHVAPRDREKRDIDFLVLEAILAHDWQHDSATWTLDRFIADLFRWFAVFVVGGEVDRQFDLGSLLLRVVSLLAAFVGLRGRLCSTSPRISRPTIVGNPSSSHILTIQVSEVYFTWREHILGHDLEEHVGVGDDFDLFTALRVQNLMAILVSHEPFELIIERMALHIEFFHHDCTVDFLRELELVFALFLRSLHLIGTLDLVFNLVVLFVRERRDRILEVLMGLRHMGSQSKLSLCG